MMVFNNVKYAWLCAYSTVNNETKISNTIYPDPEYHKKIIEAWDEFDKFLETYKPKEIESIDDNELITLSYKLKDLTDEKKELENSIESIKAELLEKTQYQNSKTIQLGSLVISSEKPRETVDYKRFITDNNLDIPQEYIKFSNPITKFTFKRS
jgi:hypothetical protein